MNRSLALLKYGTNWGGRSEGVVRCSSIRKSSKRGRRVVSHRCGINKPIHKDPLLLKSGGKKSQDGKNARKWVSIFDLGRKARFRGRRLFGNCAPVSQKGWWSKQVSSHRRGKGGSQGGEGEAAREAKKKAGGSLFKTNGG